MKPLMILFVFLSIFIVGCFRQESTDYYYYKNLAEAKDLDLESCKADNIVLVHTIDFMKIHVPQDTLTRSIQERCLLIVTNGTVPDRNGWFKWIHEDYRVFSIGAADNKIFAQIDDRCGLGSDNNCTWSYYLACN